MDERNKERMACLPPWLQRHVIFTYAVRGEVRDPNKYFSGVIGGVRRLSQSGLDERESARMVELARNGKRLSYQPCVTYGSRGNCAYGAECRNVHITGVTR